MPTAVAGLGAVTALGAGTASLEDAVRTGVSGVRTHGLADHPSYLARLPDHDLDVPGLDPATRRRAEQACRRASPRVRAGVRAALEAWVTADLVGLRSVTAERVAVVGAGSNLGSAQAEDAAERYRGRRDFVSPRLATELLDTHLVAVVAHVLETSGPTAQVAAASASGNAALVQGCRLIALEEADVCVVVGAATVPSALELGALANTGALSWDRPAVPLGADRTGFSPGEAAAAVVLESHDRRPSGPSSGTVLGWAECSHATTGPEPSAEAEAAVMVAALSSAGLHPDDIAYVSAHATGSVEGDLAEVAALRAVFGPGDGPWINATKSLTGHALSAAGLVEFVAALVQLGAGVMHPTVGLVESMATDLRHPAAGEAVHAGSVALSNGFGFGGFNTSLVLRGPR